MSFFSKLKAFSVVASPLIGVGYLTHKVLEGKSKVPEGKSEQAKASEAERAAKRSACILAVAHEQMTKLSGIHSGSTRVSTPPSLGAIALKCDAALAEEAKQNTFVANLRG